MRYLRQFMILLLITFAGEVCHFLLPLPIPAGIYGMVLLLILLETKLLPLEYVRDTGLFLVEIMPVMFIPAAVELMVSWDIIKPLLLPLIFSIVIVTLLVMAVSGHVTQFLLARGKLSTKEKEDEAYLLVKEKHQNE